MSDNYAYRMLALSMAHIRQRMRDDLGIAAMVDGGDLTIRMKKGSLFGRDASGDFGTDLRRRIIEAQEFLDRADWFTIDAAQAKMLASQRPLLDRLQELAGA